ncbi:MAG: Fur family transcriptional regulator [Actinomycetota bacterium]
MSTDSHRHGGDALDAGAWTRHATERLGQAGFRSGGARTAVMERLAAQDCCLTAQEIFDALRADGRKVGLASVYRALEVLQRLGLVQRLDLGGGTARYEAARGVDHHHHIVCLDCGRVSPFEDRRLETAIDRVARAQDFSVDEHDVVLRGRCPDCRAA